MPLVILIENIPTMQILNNSVGYYGMKRRALYYIPLMLLAFGMAIRCLFIGSMPGGLNQDEASIAYDAWALLHSGIDRWGLSWPVHFISWGSGQNALYAYLSMPFIAIGGINLTSIRIAAALLGVITLILIWRLAKARGRESELIYLLIFVTSPWHIMASRWALESNAAPAFVLFGTYFLFRAAEKPGLFFPLGAAFITLSVYAYGTAYFFAPLYLLCSFIIIYRTLGIKLPHLFISATASLLIAIPIILFIFNNRLGIDHLQFGPFTIPKYPGEARYSGIFLLFAEGGISSIPDNAINVLQLLLAGKDDGLPWNASPFWGPQYVLLTPFLIAGMLVSFKSKDLGNRLMLAWFLCALLTAVLTQANINRINLVWIPSLWLAGTGVLSLDYKHIVSRTTRYSLFVCGVLFCIHYFNSWQKEIAKNFYWGLDKAIIETIKNSPPDSKIAVTQHSNPMSTLLFSQTPPQQYISSVDITDRRAAFVHVRSFDRFYFGISNYQHNQFGGWIAHKSEIGLFDPLYYRIKQYGDYAAIIKYSSQEITCRHPLDATNFHGSQDYGLLGINAGVSGNGGGIRFSGSTNIPRGLGIHGLSNYETDLPENSKSLTIGLGMTQNAECSNGLLFKIYADSKLIYSNELKKNDIEFIELKLPPAKRLRLLTHPGNDNRCDHGAWLTPTIGTCK